MSRRSHAGGSSYMDDEREYHYSHRDQEYPRRSAAVAEYDETEIRARRRVPAPEPDFLRKDYGRKGEVGELVVRERSRERERPTPPRSHRGGDLEVKEEIQIRERSRERPRRREVVEEDREEVIISKGQRERERPRERDYEEVLYYPEPDRRPPQVRSEREEFLYYEGGDRAEPFRPPPIREPVGDIRGERIAYDFRPRHREPSPESVSREEIIIRDSERERERPRYREERDEEIIIRDREKDRRRYEDRDEEIIIRRDERSRERPRLRGHYDEEEISIRERDRDFQRPRERSYERDSLNVLGAERGIPRARSRGDVREEELIIRHDEGRARAPSTRGDFRGEDMMMRREAREREPVRQRERSRERDDEDIIIRHSENARGKHNDEIIIRRNERSPSPDHSREADLVRAPPIHQEVITHHRHIDHGYERAPEPPRMRSPSSAHDERIEIRRRGNSHGRHYDEDIVFERETGGRRQLEGVHRGRGFRDRDSDSDRLTEIKDLAIMDNRDKGRRFEAQPSPKDRMWTEITRDLVSEEAIREKGYEFEETPDFFYVMEYLRYEDVLALVELTDEIKDDRRRRIRDMQEERENIREERPPPRRAIADQEWDEERVIEREIIYDGPPRRGYR